MLKNMEEKKLSGEESLQLIQQMIQVAKDDHRENGDGWLIWGWLLFLASLSSVILSYTEARKYIGYVWTGMLVIGTIVYIAGRIQKKKKEKVQTYVQELLEKLGAGFFISLIVIIIASFQSKTFFTFGYYYVLYAFWMFIHGSAIRFRPLIIGAVVNWAAALAIFAIADFKYDMMISTVAILVGYLIPGYMLRADYRKKTLSQDRIIA
jgi:Flp pilus assembly protein TadB